MRGVPNRRFVPAYNPWANWTQQAFGYAWVDHYRTPPDWNFDLANLTNFHDDYGLVTLLEPFGKPPLDPRTGYFQLDVLRNKSAILRAKVLHFAWLMQRRLARVHPHDQLHCNLCALRLACCSLDRPA